MGKMPQNQGKIAVSLEAQKRPFFAANPGYIETCLEAFGANRCKFESDFSVNRHVQQSRAVEALKRLSAQCRTDFFGPELG
jgi:hypothetical protein